MWPLAKIRDEFNLWLKGLASFVLLGAKITTVEYTLPDLSDTAAVAAAIPAGALLLSVTAIVDTAVVTSSAGNAFNLGITGGDADAFGADIAGAAGTTSDETDYTVSPTSLWSTSAQGITVDGTGAETLSSGAVRIKVTYLQGVVPIAA
jgi:alpha-tubulin suppressor-like RCC1 family protein